MTKLSFSTLNALHNAPHTWLCKVMELPTYTTTFFEQGKQVHKIIQNHCLGVEKHPLCSHLPEFERVEKSDFDEDMHITKKYSGYLIHGYVDMISDKRKQFADIKSGSTPWGVKKMATHPQFWMYSWMLGYNDFLLINAPKEVDIWNESNITTMDMTFTSKHHDKAKDFIDQGIHIIKNIKEYVAKEDFQKSRRYCFYQGCEWCQKA